MTEATPACDILLCLEGGGTRCQAAVLDGTGACLGLAQSSDVNTNFVSGDAAQQAVVDAVTEVLDASGIDGGRVWCFASALVGPRFGPELLGRAIPNATYHYASERDVVFARAGVYNPHGVAVVAATGCTAWGVRKDDGRTAAMGGWGTLLGDEGSAYAVGVAALRTAARVYDGRIATTTRLVDTLIDHFGIDYESYRPDMYRLAYREPISRPEIAALARVVTRLAADGDLVALQIVQETADDLAALALDVAHRIFDATEIFVVAAAGGLLNAGELVLGPLRRHLADEFPGATLIVGAEEPAVALGRLVLNRGL